MIQKETSEKSRNWKENKEQKRGKAENMHTLSLKERGGRMTVPFFCSTLPMLLPAAAAKVKQIGSHISSLEARNPRDTKTNERKRKKEEEIKKSEGTVMVWGWTFRFTLEIFAPTPTTEICPLGFRSLAFPTKPGLATPQESSPI